MVAGTKGADDRAFAPWLDMAKLPAIPELSRRGQGVGPFNYTVAAIDKDSRGVNHSVIMVRRDTDHDRACPLAMRARGEIGIEVAPASNTGVFGIVDQGLNIGKTGLSLSGRVLRGIP